MNSGRSAGKGTEALVSVMVSVLVSVLVLGQGHQEAAERRVDFVA